MSTDRDFAAEMRHVVDEATAQGPYVPRQLATEIAEKLRANDPGLLDGWLDAQAEHFVWQMINDRDRSARAHVRATSKRGAFADAAKDHATGNPRAFYDFLSMRFTVENGTRRSLATLTAGDLKFVADDYQSREQKNAFMKTVMLRLAKKVGADTVADHFTNEQLAAMFDSTGGRAA